MNPTAIYSKSGKGVQEASGKTSLLKRPDRAVLSAIDGRATLADVAQKVGRPYDPSFLALITQLDKDGFIREVTAGAASAPLSSPPSRPAPPKPAAKPMDPASDLDFSSLGGASKPASPPSRPASPPAPKPPSPQQAQQAKAQISALDKAREEAEAKAAAERERVKREAEEKAKSEIESKMRADAEKRMKDEAEARAKAAAAAEAEAKVRAAREAAVRAAAEAKAKVEAEAKAKLEVERKAREEAERARREAEEKARREAEELRQKLEAERRAREEAERKAREEAERLRREAEEHARQVREEAERKAREESDRMRRELEAERQRLEEERRKEEEERAARRKQRDEEERREDEERAARRKQRDEEDQRQRQEAAPPPPPPEAPKAPAKGGSFADSLLADLDSFTNKDEEEQKARRDEEAQRQESARKAQAEAEQRRREEAERAEREAGEREAEARRREEEEARRREEEKRKAREEEERIAREEERRKREAEEIQRKAEAATAAAIAKQAGDGDIPISDDDLDLDEVKQERKALGIDEKQEKQKAKEAEREAKRRRRAEEKKQREAEKRAAKSAAPLGPRTRRSSSWGRPVALFLLVILLAAIGAAHVVPLDVTPYEKAATEALGQQVRIGSARLWLFTGVQVRFDGVRVGDARIGRVVTHPALGSVFGEQKHFSSIELERVTLPQSVFGEALFSRVRSERFSVERIFARDLELQGGLALPKLDADVALNSGGAVSSATLRGPDGLNARISPKGETLELEATAAGFPLPIGPDVTLSQFAMKGTATHQGMNITEWGGAIFNGAISGAARVRWGSTWEVDGVVTVRGINAAVFAPALLSQGNADGTGRFSMSGSEPAKLLGTGRLDGRFSISKGTLGSFDLSRAIQSRGKTVTGTTQFSELNGQVSYDRGTVALRNVTIGAGALNAGASADIAKGGALTGRIIADVKTAAQTLSATLNLGGTVKEPQVRD